MYEHGLQAPDAQAAKLQVRQIYEHVTQPQLLKLGSLNRKASDSSLMEVINELARYSPDSPALALARLGLTLACKSLQIVQRCPWAGIGRSEHPPKSGRIHIRWCRSWVSYLRALGPLLSR